MTPRLFLPAICNRPCLLTQAVVGFFIPAGAIRLQLKNTTRVVQYSQ